MDYKNITADKFREEQKNAKLNKALELLYLERTNNKVLLFPSEVNRQILENIKERGFGIGFEKKSKKFEAHYVVTW